MRRVMVRYRLKPERVEENEVLVRAVYEELEGTRPEGLRYATFKLEDGVSFVHLALHTADRPAADGFYLELLGWRTERIETAARTYHALDVGRGFGGGIVECGTRRPLWLPYVGGGGI